MSLPAGFLEELAGRLRTADVIGKRVKLIRRGRQHLGLCPFHGEKTPSFYVYDDHFHCFGCGAHGSAIDFVMRSDSVGFREAVERLAALAGLPVPRPTPEAEAHERKRRSLHEALEAATRYFGAMLRMPEGKPALDYLRRRGLAEAAIERFRLGYAPDGRFAVKAALQREGFGEDLLVEAGLLVQPDDPARGAYDRFRGRVIFPIADRRSRIVGFGGRILGEGEPKYLNSPETPLFHKGRLLYGIDHAAQPARERGQVIAVEGYMDVIGLSEAGFPNVVAPLGTALTEDQLRALWQLAAEPVLLFDPDAAGERAALRAAERALPLLKPGLGLRFAQLQIDTRDDPDRLASRYPRQFLERALAEAAPISEFLFRVETKGRISVPAEERAATEQRLRARAATIGDAVVRSHVQQRWRDLLWRDRFARGGRSARSESRGGTKAAFASTPARSPALPATAAPLPATHDAERTLLAIVLHQPAFFHDVEEDFGSLHFDDPDLDGLRQALVQSLSGTAPPGRDELSEMLRRHGQEQTMRTILEDQQVMAHRLIAPEASRADVLATWRENLATVRRRSGEGRHPLPASTAPDAIIARLRVWAGEDDETAMPLAERNPLER